ncbi:hypothetical protein SAMN05216553_101385 [Lentzea fradiae]|uniref:Uncharacterized protein n=1 Tax=Lentzea fradiae TaxID=200378 RepID=A0A1G7KP35_9PSEU|nr:Ig-like domain-containing protein [Lentzea fradiae]SDF38710.1 hypothetical protein SAMN05216553_101385 [Lentzea fradiae]
MRASPRRSELVLLVFLAVVFAVSATVVIGSVVHIQRAGLTVEGIEDGAVVTAEAVPGISVTAEDPGVLDRVEVLVDDAVIATRREWDRLTLAGFEPQEGDHTLLARVRNATPLLLDAKVEHAFTITRCD